MSIRSVFYKRKKLFFGNDVQINDYVHISVMSSVSIGDNVLMASHSLYCR